MKRSFYFARRIPTKASEEECLSISPEMSSEEIFRLYVEKSVDFENYISNGPWILRPFFENGAHQPNQFPKEVTPHTIWEMVKKKIVSSSAIVALIEPKSYGTIVELSYAAGLGNIAVYVLPAEGVTIEECEDLWMSFQASLQTSELWDEEDIRNIPLFTERGINSISEYTSYIMSIVPKFLKRGECP